MNFPTLEEVATAELGQLRTWLNDLPACRVPEDNACIIAIVEKLVSYWPKTKRVYLPLPEKAPVEKAAEIKPTPKREPPTPSQPETTGSDFFKELLKR